MAVEAIDNRAVHRMEFSIAGKTFTVSAPEADGRTYRVQIPGGEVPAGTHTLIARAVDRVGNFASTTATVTATLADRDGDGVLEDADCNDTNPAVRPGATDKPDNGIDENCDGADALPRVDATVSNSWVATTRTTKATILKVRGAPAGRPDRAAVPRSRLPVLGPPLHVQGRDARPAQAVPAAREAARRRDARDPRPRAGSRRQGRAVHDAQAQGAADRVPLPLAGRNETDTHLRISCTACGS